MKGRDFKAVVEEVRAHSDVVNVISSYFPLKRSGQTFKACCPFHKEKTPSFHVNPQRQIFHCFGCNLGGDVFKFVMEYEKVDFITALKILADRAGVSADFDQSDPGRQADKKRLYELHEQAALFYQQQLLKSPAGAPGRDYLKTRSLADETVREFLIGFAPESWDTLIRWGREQGFSEEELEKAGLVLCSQKSNRRYDRFRGRLMFTVFDETGRVIGFSGRTLGASDQGAKYVNSPETLLFHKSRVLFALDKARREIADRRRALIVEGQIDAIRCHEAGVRNTVASQGTALTPDHARILKRYADEVVLVLDADAAGENAAMKSIDAFVSQELGVRVCSLPPGEDPDTLIQKEGADAFRERVAEAPSAIDFKLDVLERREDLSSEAGLMRAARNVEETLAQVPGAVLREKMAERAAERLGISAQALLRDMRKHQMRRRPSTPEAEAPAAQPAAVCPPEEFQLLELLLQYPDALLPLVENYILPDYLQSAEARCIYEALLRHEPAGLMAALQETSDGTQRLASRLQMSPDRSACSELGGEAAAREHTQGLVLALLRRRAQQEYETLRAERSQNGATPELQHRIMELKQFAAITRCGWAKAQPHLEVLH